MTTIIRPAQFNDWRAVPGPDAVQLDLRESRSAEPPSGLTLGPYLETWLSEVVRRSVRPKTYVSYGGVVRNHLIPGLGDIRLTDLRPADVQAFLNAKAASGLAPRTVAYLRNVLRQALGHAERTELVGRNVARLARPPRIIRREVQPLSPEEARVFLGAIKGERWEALYLVALGAGLRQGEILGLAWADLDLEAGTVRVRRALQRVEGTFAFVEPKSATSRRTVALPAIVGAALVDHRARAEQARPTWQAVPPGFDDLVFTTRVGTPIDGISVTRRFQRILKRAGLRQQRFHDLRHACASLLLSQGVPARVVMETLGHSQISLTLNTYSHVIPALGREAASRMDAVLTAPTD